MYRYLLKETRTIVRRFELIPDMQPRNQGCSVGNNQTCFALTYKYINMYTIRFGKSGRFVRSFFLLTHLETCHWTWLGQFSEHGWYKARDSSLNLWYCLPRATEYTRCVLGFNLFIKKDRDQNTLAWVHNVWINRREMYVILAEMFNSTV